MSEIKLRYNEAKEIIAKMGQPSISGLQRKMRIGYNHAHTLIEKMIEEGVLEVGHFHKLNKIDRR